MGGARPDTKAPLNIAPMPNPVFSSLPTSIFQHMTVLALKHDAINLGQGFPDQDGPLSLREVAARQLLDGPNQYPPSKGLLVLRHAVAAHGAKFYGLDYDPEDEVLITSGGTEAITGALMAMAGVGDEVVMIEPTYDSYRPMAEAAGAVVKAIQLGPPHWRLTEGHPDQLAAQPGGPRAQPRRTGRAGQGGDRHQHRGDLRRGL